MAYAEWRERIVRVTTTGSTDIPLFLVPAGASATITAVRVATAASGAGTGLGLVDGTTSAAGTNVLMSNADLALTATGLKRNTATNQGVGGFLFTAAGAVWWDAVGITGNPVLHVHAIVRMVEPGDGEP